MRNWLSKEKSGPGPIAGLSPIAFPGERGIFSAMSIGNWIITLH